MGLYTTPERSMSFARAASRVISCQPGNTRLFRPSSTRNFTAHSCSIVAPIPTPGSQRRVAAAGQQVERFTKTTPAAVAEPRSVRSADGTSEMIPGHDAFIKDLSHVDIEASPHMYVQDPEAAGISVRFANQAAN